LPSYVLGTPFRGFSRGSWTGANGRRCSRSTAAFSSTPAHACAVGGLVLRTLEERVAAVRELPDSGFREGSRRNAGPRERRPAQGAFTAELERAGWFFDAERPEAPGFTERVVGAVAGVSVARVAVDLEVDCHVLINALASLVAVEALLEAAADVERASRGALLLDILALPPVASAVLARYGPRRAEDRRPFAYIAFGGGRHKCTGNAFSLLQIKTIVAVPMASLITPSWNHVLGLFNEGEGRRKMAA